MSLVFTKVCSRFLVSTGVLLIIFTSSTVDVFYLLIDFLGYALLLPRVVTLFSTATATTTGWSTAFASSIIFSAACVFPLLFLGFDYFLDFLGGMFKCKRV